MSCRFHWQGVMLTAFVMAVGASAVVAEPYWIAYEGDQFPEEVGWRRVYGNEHGPYAGGAERSLGDGVLTLDSMRHDQIVDFYRVQRPIDPAPGELFVANWRVFVDPVSDPRDAGVVIARDQPPGDIVIRNGPNGIVIEPGHVTIPIEPQRFHSFSVQSADMEAFDLQIDGEHAYSGHFEPISLLRSLVTFGDGAQGERSLTRWDYVRFGVVPEPSVLMALVICTLLVPSRGYRAARP